MLNNASVELRAKFLEEFTEEILAVLSARNERKARALLEIEKRRQKVDIEKLKLKYIEQKKEIDEGIKKEEFVPSIVHKEKPMPAPAQTAQPAKPAPVLIPLQPIPGMEFGRIAHLVNDPRVSSIECPGEDKEVIIKRESQISKTDIKLSREEIDKIISDFSEKARIPLEEGLLRARIGNLQISAIVSKVASSRFILTKFYMPQIRSIEPRLNQGLRPAFGISPGISRTPVVSQIPNRMQSAVQSAMPGQAMPAKQMISPPFPKIPIPPQPQQANQQQPQQAPTLVQQENQPAAKTALPDSKIITPINRPFMQQQNKTEQQKKP